MIIIASLIFGGVFISKKALQSRRKSEPTPTPPAGELEPTETLEPELDREVLKIKVLNGSGEPGAAGAAVQFLKDKGYSDEIEAGNADSYNYDETVIQIKEEKKDFFDLLVEDLVEEYSVSSESAELDEESEFEAIIIIGKNSS